MKSSLQTPAEAFWVEHLSPEQRTTLAEFRAVLQSHPDDLLLEGHCDDVTMCRFLKARRWDVNKTLDLWKEMAHWRRTYVAAPADPPFTQREKTEIKKYYPHFFHKTDKLGRPVHYELVGELNITELLRVASKERLLRHHVIGWENTKANILPACSQVAQRDVFTCLTVLDLKGLGMGSFNKDVRSFICDIASIDQAYYPEHLGQMFIVNAPLVFKAIWAVVRPWLEARTQRKIQVFMREDESRAALLDVIPAENLITRLGGLSVADPMSEFSVGPYEDEKLRAQALKSGFGSGNLGSSTSSTTVAAVPADML